MYLNTVKGITGPQLLNQAVSSDILTANTVPNKRNLAFLCMSNLWRGRFSNMSCARTSPTDIRAPETNHGWGFHVITCNHASKQLLIMISE